MKKMIILLLAGAFLFGCASLKESEWAKHDTMYASSSHMSYSIWGYKNPDANWQKLSEEQGWWGKSVPYVPAK